MAYHSHLSTRTLLGRPLSITATGLAVAMTCAVAPAGVAMARQDPIPPEPYPWGYGYGAEKPGHGGNSGGGEGGNRAPDPPAGGDEGDGAAGPVTICGAWRYGTDVCGPFTFPGEAPAGNAPAPTVSPVQLAQQAWGRLPIPKPEVRTAPPRGSEGLVGLPQWFWVTNWTSHADRVSAGGVWAQVTARPTSLVINPGSGLPSVSCSGAGRAYDRRLPAHAQRSECSYTYQRSSAGLPGSAYRVTVTVTWGGTWVGSGGAGGALPALSRSATFSLRVAEGQAVTGGR
ncbi:hypothetical protein BZB76_0020 [Actinomadura pelletieri DSM 43383]|uniref:ATP/GTP-binding protein n=1 Tax=Actinomadura pelletieri DSM 43383 TaxID=1120940 RepID=A0A495QWX4_9ACTN|nr:hypothetical protein BZB76_0020 [Actinomadura pelletieri DSM 43383]